MRSLVSAVDGAAQVIVFRVMPVVGCVLAGWSCSWRVRTIILALAVAGAAFSVRETPAFGVHLASLLIGYAYFVLVSYAVCCFGGMADVANARGARKSVMSIGLLTGLFALYVVVPARMFTVTSGAQLALVALGWERTLAAYSYHYEGSRNCARPPLREGLFFLLVSPELVFPSRGRRCAPALWTGGLRVLCGALLLGAVAAMDPLVKAHLPARDLRRLSEGLLYGAKAMAALYAAHSGLAHVQIGVCRMIGYEVPERYRYPFAAATPREFWERWNTYMGSWVRIYLYGPLLRMRAGARRIRVSTACFATVAVFTWLGVMHALYWLASGAGMRSGTIVEFASWGVLLALANAAEGWVRARGKAWHLTAFLLTSRLLVGWVAILSTWLMA
jgi:hypothetical protein